MMEEPAESSSRMNGSALNGAGAADDPEEAGPARALTLHLLRMLETRMDAAGIALNSEVESFSSRVQLKLLAAGALFIAIWGGIVLLAIALPDPWRVPVLAGVILLFVAGAAWAQLAAKKLASPQGVGSMRWFLDALKLDFEVLTRSLSPKRAVPSAEPGAQPEDKRSSSHDAAA